ncbi:unnamed protein product, partial [Mesorhabditis belari]|uniref:Major facilitator superfamily (MFS) profile domain-containing protein n=1 Tax=Mesorhabditis belari TaxID=2138241 RepID=A0AAF3EKL6_9BILA
MDDVLMDWLNETCRQRFDLQLDESTLSIIWSNIVGALSVGAILGALLIRPLSENCGRKGGLLINGVFNMIAAEIMYLAKPRGLPELLVIGRLFLGVNIGITSGIVPLYIQEITPQKHQGAAEALHLIASAFSNVLSLLIGLPEIFGNEENWELALAVPGFLAFALCLYLPFCPESPKYLLVSKEDPAATLEALNELYGKQQASIEYLKLLDETKEKMYQTEKGSFRDLFENESLRSSAIIAILVMSANQFNGLSVVMSYSTNMFTNARLEPWLAKYGTLGRFTSLFALLCFTAFTAIQQYGEQLWAAYGTIFALLLYMFLFGIASPLPWVINLELFSPKYRSTAMSLSVFVVYGLSFLVTSLYLPFQNLVGSTLSYLPFIFLSAITTLILFFYLPETRKTEIDQKALIISAVSRTISEGI